MLSQSKQQYNNHNKRKEFVFMALSYFKMYLSTHKCKSSLTDSDMYKPFSFIIALLFLSLFGYSQYTQQITTVKSQARIFADATIKKDYPTVMKYTIIDAMPKARLNVMTEDHVLKILQTADSQREKEGISIKSIKFGNVLSMVKVNFEFQCTLEQITETKMQVGSIISKSTLLALSRDNGITWKFADATGRSKEEMRSLIPRLSDGLIFTKVERPQFVRDTIPVGKHKFK